jgi:YD repeat-containing protein
MAVHVQFIASVAQPSKKQNTPTKSARNCQRLITPLTGAPLAVADLIEKKARDRETNPNQTGVGAVNAPYWVEAVRSGNTFSCYVSTDGQSWVQVGTTQTFTTAQQVYVGLAVSSENPAALGTATFSDVSVTLGSALPNPIVSSLTPASGPPGTSVTVGGSGFGQSQGSSAVYFNGAVATVSGWSDSQITAIVPNSAATGPVSVVVGSITGQGPNFSVVFGVQLTNSLGNQTSYSSSVAGGQWSFTDAQGSGCSTCTTRGTVHNQYDGNGNLAFSTDALGNTTIYGYDSSNNLISQFIQLGPSSAATTRYAYNSLGEVTSATDALGRD